MAEARRIVELGVGDVDLVEGLWKEMVAHHRGADRRGPAGARRRTSRGAMRREQYVDWLEGGEGQMFLVPGEGAEGAPLGYAFLRIGPLGADLGPRRGGRGPGVALGHRGGARDGDRHGADRPLPRAPARRSARSGGASPSSPPTDGAAELYEREGFRPFVNHLLAPIRVDARRRSERVGGRGGVAEPGTDRALAGGAAPAAQRQVALLRRPTCCPPWSPRWTSRWRRR